MKRDGKTSTVLIDNSALAHVIAVKNSDVQTDAEISASERPAATTCSPQLANINNTFEIFGGESRNTEVDEGQRYRQKVELDKTVEHIFENGSCLILNVNLLK